MLALRTLSLLRRRRVIILGLLCAALVTGFLAWDRKHYPTEEELERAQAEAYSRDALLAMLGPPQKVITAESAKADLPEFYKFMLSRPPAPGKTVLYYEAKHGFTGAFRAYDFEIDDATGWRCGSSMGYAGTWELRTRRRIQGWFRNVLGR
jgi:hypothetical protein